MVSVLVSVWTPEPPKPILHTQLELEARVGIEPHTVVLKGFLDHSAQLLKHNLRLPTGAAPYPFISHFVSHSQTRLCDDTAEHWPVGPDGEFLNP